MTIEAADAKFGLLLNSTVPLVLAPVGPHSPTAPRVRGVVRADPTHARIVLAAGNGTPGIGVQYELLPQATEFNVAAAVDHARFTVAPNLTELARDHAGRVFDRHGNIIIDANELGFDNSNEYTAWDQNIFRLLGILVHGGGFPWFEEDFTFAGFLFTTPETCRIYLRMTSSGTVYGTELPMTYPDGRPFTGYAYLAQALAPLARTGDLTNQPVIDAADDYCTAVIDLRAWLGPATP
ncbi:hypothetical protein [Nocardia sp. NPDC005366]|uniref:hypothetical protein n=1 Tax=Nocardia sp. NPDC005366 TaxID=3156878 RepID=UPI00339E87C2